MKITVLLVFLVAITTAAFGQYGGGYVSAQPQIYHAPDHPLHASQGSLRPETNLLGTMGTSSGHGELPLWEFGSPIAEPPLGDVARAYRKEHATAEKATIIWRP